MPILEINTLFTPKIRTGGFEVIPGSIMTSGDHLVVLDECNTAIEVIPLDEC